MYVHMCETEKINFVAINLNFHKINNFSIFQVPIIFAAQKMLQYSCSFLRDLPIIATHGYLIYAESFTFVNVSNCTAIVIR